MELLTGNRSVSGLVWHTGSVCVCVCVYVRGNDEAHEERWDGVSEGLTLPEPTMCHLLTG